VTVSNSASRTADGYGIVERERATKATTQLAERIRLVGYGVLAGGFDAAAVADLSARLDRVMERQVDEFGAEPMAAIGDTLTARCPLVYDDAFLSLVTHAELLEVVRDLLGGYVVLMQQNGVINPAHQPHTQVAYHRDLPYQHFVSSRPLAISALFCIDPFRLETGATTVIPASHKTEAFPSADVAAELDTTVTAEAGSFIVFDSMLFHRAGVNVSERPRRAVNQVFTVPIIAQQVSLPDALGGRHADNPELARLLGYESAPARSVAAWRERRLARSTASRSAAGDK
jgi:ectoine hydroxylase-related dioxygenase (phytanoyl-CoA dioxygenase family)